MLGGLAGSAIPKAAWTEKWWFATADELRANDFNLSASRYRPQSREQVEHRDPLELLDELKAIEVEILEEIDQLRDKLRVSVPVIGSPWLPLGEVCVCGNQGTTPKTLGRHYATDGVPFLRGEDVNGCPIDAEFACSPN